MCLNMKMKDPDLMESSYDCCSPCVKLGHSLSLTSALIFINNLLSVTALMFTLQLHVLSVIFNSHFC